MWLEVAMDLVGLSKMLAFNCNDTWKPLSGTTLHRGVT